MPTSGVINGTSLRVYIGGNVVAYATSSNIDMSTELRETIHKDNPGSGFREVAPGQKSATIGVEAFLNEDGANNAWGDLFAAWTGRTEIEWVYSTEASGDTRLSGNGYITSLSSTAPVEENSTVSLTIEVNGAITKVTIT